MDYKENYDFNKFAQFIKSEEKKEKIYKLYSGLKEESRKRLFLFLNYDKSRIEILDLLDKEGILVMEGLTNHLIKNCKMFETEMEFICNNDTCEKFGRFTSNKYLYKKCPDCSKPVRLTNKESLMEFYDELYLNYYDFYLFNDVDYSLYLIHNKYNNKYYLKKGDEAFSNWVHLKLISNNCDVDKLLFYSGGSSNNPRVKLLSYLKENNFIKHIDNLNFKPTSEKVFKEEGKTFFNIYSGNENLNSQYLENGLEIKKDCPNSYELMKNLTGKDENGVNYLLDVLAMILQEPHIKSKQLIIFYGEEASGKGTFYDIILKPLFSGYITKILGKKIKSQFNGFMSKNLVLVLEEVKADKEEEDTLKELVTEDSILINKKSLPEREENNFLTVFGFSNEPNPINAGKRRGVYFMSRTLGGSIDKAPEYRKKYEKEIPLEFQSFVKLLKTRKYDRVKIMAGYETAAKNQVIEQNMTLIERFYSELCNYDSLGKYVSELILTNQLDSHLDLQRYLYTFEGVRYVHASVILDLYNIYLRKNKYTGITLNKFSQFWQISKIDKENKDHWRRLINPDNEKKTQYVNIDFINEQIKKEYEKDE